MLASCAAPTSQTIQENVEARKQFENYAQLISKKSEWLSFDLEYVFDGEYEGSVHSSICYKTDDQACFMQTDSKCHKVTDYAFHSIDTDNNTIKKYNHHEGFEKHQH